VVFSNDMIKNDILARFGTRGSIVEVLVGGSLDTHIYICPSCHICHLSFVSYDINDRLCHMTQMTDDI
jgi:hypothetical protein